MRHRASRMLAATLVLVGAASCGSGGSSTNERPAVRERGRNTTTVPNAIGIVKDALSASRAADTANFVGSFFFDATALGTEDPAAGLGPVLQHEPAHPAAVLAEHRGDAVRPGELRPRRHRVAVPHGDAAERRYRGA